MLNLYSFSPAFFNEQHLARLDVFGTQAAIAMQNAQLYQRAHELAAMQERQRLSHDLHDAVSQMLFTSSIISEALPGLAKRSPEKVWPQLDQIRRLNRGALAEMRKLLLELRSESIGDMDMHQLLEQLAQAVMGHTLLDVALDVNIHAPPPGNVKLMLYRITQEALNNIVKHARASHVAITLTVHSDHGDLMVKNNGDGFVIGERTPGHLGLSIMQKRAEAVGALFNIESAPGQGTCITVAWKDQN